MKSSFMVEPLHLRAEATNSFDTAQGASENEGISSHAKAGTGASAPVVFG